MKTSETQPTATLPTEYYLQKDDQYGIFVKNEANRSITVQVVIFIPQRRKKADGTIEFMGNNPNAIWTKQIPTRKKTAPPINNVIILKPEEFKKNYRMAIEEAKKFLQEERQTRDMCLGALAETWNQSKEFNKEPEKK